MLTQIMRDVDEESIQSKARLGELELEFDREMRARGFDTEQVHNLALPSALAKMYTQIEELRCELEEFSDAE
jgi:hypothetical protein